MSITKLSIENKHFNRLRNFWPFFKEGVVVITPPLPRDGVTARTAIQVHAVNLIEIRLGKDGSLF